jgi:hypothetical protein
MGINIHVYSYWGVRTKWNDQFYNAYEAVEEANIDTYGYNKEPADAQAPVDLAEFFKIQLMAKPVPYSDYYLRLQEVKQRREQREAEESATVDQISDT